MTSRLKTRHLAVMDRKTSWRVMGWTGVGVALLGAVAVLGPLAQARTVETPGFTRMQSEGDYEVRRYGDLTLIETEATGDFQSALSEGFRRLAGFIFGRNAAGEKIAMTAPVLSFPAAPADAPRGPGGGGPTTVAFVLPRSAADPPAPVDPRVRVRRRSGAVYAVKRFSGWASAAAARRQEADLEAWARSRGLRPVGPSLLAQYDPPWVLPFLRLNEILLPVSSEASSF